jgi:hypothetical protein
MQYLYLLPGRKNSRSWVFAIGAAITCSAWFSAFTWAEGIAANQAYLQSVADKLQQDYLPARGYEYSSVKASFRLNCDGTVADVRIVEHPVHMATKKTLKGADLEVSAAVNNSAPFAKPPADFHCPTTINVRWNRLTEQAAFITCEVQANECAACDSKTAKVRSK